MTPRRYDRVKRVLDAVGAALALVVSAPLQGVVALAVLVSLGRPFLFRQRRPGRGAEPFTLVKFRTMRDPLPDRTGPHDALRLTRVGRILRATSLDELPTLVNVVRGDMSFVGPRPLLERYLPLYSAEESRRHDVRPGVTGLAQVAGRNEIDWDRRLALDVEYVERRSFGLDAAILLRTVGVVLTARGVSASGHATARPFEREPRSDED